ncbi:large-conductance mechanosensitive channel protein MscL [Candidatus Saccharibacteria bacterium]|nr:large-conductance mechanosensitive channel protein MscL [Candidatus Saccharibacteria bacterium]
MGNKVTEAAKAAKERANEHAAKIHSKQPKVVKEFAEFINQGNVIDLAVGVVIGSAFGKIITALVDYIIMPIVGMIIGGVDFSDLYITIPNWLGDGVGVRIQYGNFLQAVVDFLIVAFCIFVFVKFIKQFKLDFKKEMEDAAEAEPSKDDKIIALLEDIKKNTSKK